MTASIPPDTNPNKPPSPAGSGSGSDGHQRPVLILLHGTRMNTGQWATYPAILGDLVEVVAPDLAGHGHREGETFSVAKTMAEIDALIAAHPGRAIILGGYSMGGYLALHYAEHAPEKLAGLVLIGAATEPGGLKSWLCRRVADAWEAAGLAGMRWIDRIGFAPICDERLWRAIQQRGGQFRQVRQAWDDVMQGCSAQQLTALHCPVLIMSGRFDPLHWQAEHFAEATGQAEVMTVPHRTHFWPLRKPDEVAWAIRAWLEGLASRQPDGVHHDGVDHARNQLQ